MKSILRGKLSPKIPEFCFWHFTNAVLWWQSLSDVTGVSNFIKSHHASIVMFFARGLWERYMRQHGRTTSSSPLSSLITKFTFYFRRSDQMFVLTRVLRLLGSCYCRRAAKQTFVWARTRPSRLHPLCTYTWYHWSQWHNRSKKRPIRGFIAAYTNQMDENEFIMNFHWKTLGSAWFDLCSSSARLNCANYLRGLGQHKRLVREILSELVLLSNFKFSIHTPQKCLKFSKISAALDAPDHKCLHRVRHVQQFLFILFIYVPMMLSICLRQSCLRHVCDK